MNKSLILFLLTIIFSLPALGQGEIDGRIIKVIDGKTVVIEVSTRNRITAELQYIDVPEPEQPLYQTSKYHLEQIILGRQITFRPQRLVQTKTIGQVFVDGIDISRQMIRDGAAWYANDQVGQNSLESEVYQKTEAQAKNDRLGVWSIKDLKPAWQLRAERAELARQQAKLTQEKADKEGAEAAALTATPVKQTVKPSRFPLMSSEENLLAASDSTLKLPPNIKMVGGLLIGYNSSAKLGIIATPLMKANFSAKEGEQPLAVQILYLYYDADESHGRQSSYLVCIDSESKDFKFLKENNLIVTADDKKIVIGKAKRLPRQTDSGVKEGLIYEIRQDIFRQIASARSLEVKVGGYSRNLNGELQQMLFNLLQMSL